jgi:hypothetical protein
MSEERLDRDGRLKLAERITQIEVGPDAAAPVVDFNEHDAQTCPVCNQVAAEITAFVLHAAALASVSAEETFAKHALREAFDEPVTLG